MTMEQQVIMLDRAPARLGDLPEQFRSLAAGRWAICWLVDPHKPLLVDINDAGSIAWGRNATDLCNRNGVLMESIHPDDRGNVAAAFRQNLAGMPTEDEFRILHPGGSVRRLRARSFPVADRSGAITHVAGVAEDVSDRPSGPTVREMAASAAVARHNAHVLADQQRQNEQSQELRIVLEAALQQMPNGLILTEAPSGRTLIANQQVERLLGYKPIFCEKLEDFEKYTAIHSDGRPLRLEEYAAVRSITHGETIVNQETLFLHADGTRRVLSVTSAPIRVAEGKIIAAICTFFDVTEARRSQEAVRQAKESAEAANAAHERFLSTISQTLRTPLAPALATLASLEQRENVPKSVAEELAKVCRSIEPEAKLIDNLLDLLRLSRGGIELRRQIVDVHALLRQIVQPTHAEAVNAKDLKLESSLEAIRYQVMGDPARLRQVFSHLLDNAVKFTPAGGSILVRSVNDAGKLRIDIFDTGIGIEADAIPQLFNPFEQTGPTSPSRLGGLKLGLARAQTIIRLHGGEISARSDGPGKGAVFSIVLSVTKDPPGGIESGA